MGETLELFREVFPQTFSGTKVRVQAFRTGTWNHPSYGEFTITVETLKSFKRNFDRGNRAVPLDYGHGIDQGRTPEEQVASGWLRKQDVEEAAGGEGKLWIEAELTERAAQYVRAGEYRFFSPTWVMSWTNPETGVDEGPTLIGGALTNRPFLQGMAPAIPLSERAAAAMREVKAAPGGKLLAAATDRELFAADGIQTHHRIDGKLVPRDPALVAFERKEVASKAPKTGDDLAVATFKMMTRMVQEDVRRMEAELKRRPAPVPEAEPTDVVSLIQRRAEVVSRERRISTSAAQLVVLQEDPTLSRRYREHVVAGSNGGLE